MFLKPLVIHFILVLFLTCISCSTSNQTQTNFNPSKTSAENRLANKDYSNKPSNFQKEGEKYKNFIAELNKNRQIWREKNIPNYDFFCEKFAEGVGGDFRLNFKVRENKFVPFENLEYPKPYAYDGLETVDKIFDSLQNWVENGWSVNVKYNKNYGFPEEISGIGDGIAWWHIKVKKFEIK